MPQPCMCVYVHKNDDIPTTYLSPWGPTTSGSYEAWSRNSLAKSTTETAWSPVKTRPVARSMTSTLELSGKCETASGISTLPPSLS